MWRRRTDMTIFWSWMFSVFFISLFFLFFDPTQDSITFVKPYYDELQLCKIELAQDEPVCPSRPFLSPHPLGLLILVFIGVFTGNVIADDLNKWRNKKGGKK